MTTTAAIPLYARTEALHILDAWISEHADEIAANGGALPEELQALLDDADGAFEQKVESVALYVKSLRHSANAAREESNRLAMRARSYTNAADALESYLQRCMESAGKSAVKGALASVTIQRSSPSVTSTLTPESLLHVWRVAEPSWIRFTPASAEVNKTELKAMAKRGEKLPEGIALEHSTHVVIR